VPAGTIRAYHDTASKPGKPCSAIVGSSGITGERLRLAMPIARSLPERTCGSAEESWLNIIDTWPPSRSFSAGPVPL
jgi:hypothetical protein